MKKIIFIFIAIFVVNLSWGQSVTIKKLDFRTKDSLWTKTEKSLWKNYSVSNQYGKLMKIKDISAEDIKIIYEISNITKSRKMLKNTVSGKIIPEHQRQWMVSYTKNGKLIAFVTYDEPKKNFAEDIVLSMSAGIHQGDDDATNSETKSDIELAPSTDENIEISDEF